MSNTSVLNDSRFYMPTASQIQNLLSAPEKRKSLETLYGKKEEVLNFQVRRYEKLAFDFKKLFGIEELHLFSTPGRSEIGGNHTDHNHGRVLAASINLDSIAAAAPTEDDTVTLHSEGYHHPFRVSLDDLTLREKEKNTTAALIRGIAAGLKERGYRIGGFKAAMTSQVLVGSGLSSSASVEVLIGSIFNTLYNENAIEPDILAMIGQFAENQYFGKPCGLMDQMTCAVGGFVTIDFKDPGKPVVKKIPFDFAAQNTHLLVVDTGGNHADLTADYASVPAEMKAVARVLGGKVLRDVPYEKVLKKIPGLRAKTGDRAILRAMHFFLDNDRVERQVEALENGDFERFLDLVNASGNSSMKWLQNCYTTQAPDDQGVTLALALSENYINRIGKGACRVHGGGFAGTIQVFMNDAYIEEYIYLMASIFGRNTIKVLDIRPVGTLQVL